MAPNPNGVATPMLDLLYATGTPSGRESPYSEPDQSTLKQIAFGQIPSEDSTPLVASRFMMPINPDEGKNQNFSPSSPEGRARSYSTPIDHCRNTPQMSPIFKSEYGMSVEDLSACEGSPLAGKVSAKSFEELGKCRNRSLRCEFCFLNFVVRSDETICLSQVARQRGTNKPVVPCDGTKCPRWHWVHEDLPEDECPIEYFGHFCMYHGAHREGEGPCKNKKHSKCTFNYKFSGLTHNLKRDAARSAGVQVCLEQIRKNPFLIDKQALEMASKNALLDSPRRVFDPDFIMDMIDKMGLGKDIRNLKADLDRRIFRSQQANLFENYDEDFTD